MGGSAARQLNPRGGGRVKSPNDRCAILGPMPEPHAGERAAIAAGKLKVGLVGFGLAGRVLHAPFIRATPALQLTAVVTSRAVDGALYPAARRVSSLDALLEDPSIALVVLATPNALHVEQALRALAAGRHVVCDKPLARTAAEVRALAAAASAAGRLLIPFQNRRWDCDHRTIAALLNEGRLGRIHSYESRWSRYQPKPQVRAAWKAEPGFNGPLYDLFPHLIDQALTLFGRPARVTARLLKNRPGSAAHDFARVVLDYGAPGPQVVLEADHLDPFSDRQICVRGSLGAFGTRGLDPQEARLSAGELPGGPGWGEAPSQAGRLRLSSSAHEVALPLLAGDHGLFYRGVSAAILEGAPPPVLLEDVLTQLEIIEAALRSSETGEPVRLDAVSKER